MNLGEAFRIAFLMIRANKLRAFFTVLGTVFGVTFLIAVITLIEGANGYVEKELKGTFFGVNSVLVRRFPIEGANSAEQWREFQRRPRLTFDDAEWLEDRMETPGTISLSAETFRSVKGPQGRQLENVRVVGGSASYFDIREMQLDLGRPFSENEADRGVPVVVLGHDVVDKLFEGRSPIGKTVAIDNFPYTVIGVLAKQGSLFGQSRDNVAVAPIRSPLDGVVNTVRGTAGTLTYKVPHDSLIPAAQLELQGLMRIRRGLRPTEESNFAVETAEESLSLWNTIRGFLLAALPGLVGISLVVGAVVIMNIMLVSVSERTREIGLRKSLGAKRNDILLQFLIEAGTLSGMGGLLGILAGIGLASLVAATTSLPTLVAPWAVGLSIFLAVGVGLGAGVYPAYRASRLDPIVALRSE